MNKPKYPKLDAAILRELKDVPNTVRGLWTVRGTLKPCEVVGQAQPDVPLISKRLQALRKKGLVYFDGFAWLST